MLSVSSPCVARQRSTADWTQSQTHYFSGNLGAPRIEPGPLVCSQELLPLGHRGGLLYTAIKHNSFSLSLSLRYNSFVSFRIQTVFYEIESCPFNRQVQRIVEVEDLTFLQQSAHRGCQFHASAAFKRRNTPGTHFC
jgi:hypothetical protein